MTNRTVSTFTCDGCGDERQVEEYASLPHGWRVLTWRGGYVGDETREAHFCEGCCASRLAALDVLLAGRGKGFAK